MFHFFYYFVEMEAFWSITGGEIPLWIKIVYTSFIIFLIPVYWKYYGPANFLWFSDIALFGSAISLWLENSLIASMMAVGVLLPEIAWNIDYFGRLISGTKFIGLSDYMFEEDKPLFLRSLSLFHVVIPVILIYLMIELEYHPSAIYYQTILVWIVLPVCYFFTPEKENINWVFGPGGNTQKKIHPLMYLFLLMLFFPIVIFLPTHLLLKALF